MAKQVTLTHFDLPVFWSEKCEPSWPTPYFNIGFTFLVCPVLRISLWTHELIRIYDERNIFFLLNKIKTFLFFHNNLYSFSIEIIPISLPNQRQKKVNNEDYS